MVCAICGATNPDAARFCLSCGAQLSSSSPSAPPGRIVVSLKVAHLGDRLLALILDSILLAAVSVVVLLWAAGRWGGLTPSGFELNGAPALAALAMVFAVGFLYYWLFEALFGATLGKAVVGVSVCDAEGRRCGLKRSFIRNLLRIVDGFVLYLVGFLVALFSKQRQRLGDHLAGTYVVERGVGTLGRATLVVLWLAALGGSVWGAFTLRRGMARGTAETATEAVATTAPTPPPPVLMSGDLKLRDFAFVQSEGGPPRAEGPARPGERLFASFKAAGLSTDAEGKAHMQYGFEALDANGLTMHKTTQEFDGAPGASGTATISVWFDVPKFAPPGASKLRVTARDNVKKTEGEIVAPFMIEAPAPVVSRQLEMRGLRFTQSEDGPPLEPAVVKEGATLFIAGDVAGMQFREDQADVSVAFEVLGPGGDKVLDKPNFLEVKGSYPYHPPTFFVPITAHLTLPAGAPKGVYKERYLVTDRVAGATKVHELTFKLE